MVYVNQSIMGGDAQVPSRRARYVIFQRVTSYPIIRFSHPSGGHHGRGSVIFQYASHSSVCVILHLCLCAGVIVIFESLGPTRDGNTQRLRGEHPPPSRHDLRAQQYNEGGNTTV